MKLPRWVFFLSVCLVGCGYSFQGGSTVLPANVRRIYIPTVANNSTDARVAGLLTDALRDRFDRVGLLTVVDSLDESDAVLSVRVKRLGSSTLTSTSNTNQALQVDNVMVVAAELKRINGQVLWSNPNFSVDRNSAATRSALVTSSAEFAASGLGVSDILGLNDREVARSQQQAAMSSLIDLAARRIYEEAVAPDF